MCRVALMCGGGVDVSGEVSVGMCQCCVGWVCGSVWG